MIDLFPYQESAKDIGLRRNTYFAFACGLGKTVTAIESAKAVLRSWELPASLGAVLVVCPKRLRLQWQKMIEDQDSDRPVVNDYNINTVPQTYRGWVIVHYEQLMANIDTLAKTRWAVVIVDEAHHIKNRKAIRTLAVKKLTTLRKIALSATPMDRSPHELWSVLHWLYPERYTSYWKFVEKYCETEHVAPWLTGGHIAVQKIVGAKNSQLMAQDIGSFFIRYTKEQVAPQLPPKIMSKVAVEMTLEQKELYDAIDNAKDIIVDYQNISLVIPSVLAKLTKLQIMTSCPNVEGLDVPSGKIEWLQEYIKDNPEESMVVFTRFRHTAEVIAEKLGCEIIIGGQYQPPVDFLAGRARIVVGTIAAMGEGVDGLQRASTAVFVDQEWSSVLMAQAVDRIHRIGIDAPKNIVYLYCPGTKDELVLKALEHKWTEQEIVYHFLEEAHENN